MVQKPDRAVRTQPTAIGAPLCVEIDVQLLPGDGISLERVRDAAEWMQTLVTLLEGYGAARVRLAQHGATNELMDAHRAALEAVLRHAGQRA